MKMSADTIKDRIAAFNEESFVLLRDTARADLSLAAQLFTIPRPILAELTHLPESSWGLMKKVTIPLAHLDLASVAFPKK